jgi:predicted Zn-dependent protease
MTHHQIDLRQLATRDPAAAEAQLRPLVLQHPEIGAYPLYLGVALLEQGRASEAIPFLDRAARLYPTDPRTWRGLAAAYRRDGNVEAAAAATESELAASSKTPALLEAGLALARNQLAVAERLLKAQLTTEPDDIAALRMLAEVAGRLGRFADARTILDHTLAIAPSFRQARYNLAIVLLRQQQPAQALAELEALSADDPHNIGYKNLRAAALASLGDLDGAVINFEATVAARPNQANLWLNFGHALKTAGRQADGVSAYRRAIALEPRYGEAWWSLANLKTVTFDDGDIAAMTASLARTDLREGDALHLHFALGKALEDCSTYAESFEHYCRGNALRRSQVGYNPDHVSRKVSNIIAAIEAGFLSGSAGGWPGRDPIFIVGLPRSGSTLIEQILASHPEIEGTQELPDIQAIAREAVETEPEPYPRRLMQLSPDELSRLGEQYIERTRPQRALGRLHFIDKMPNNWIHVPLILRILPNAKIIDARREPMACGFSNFKQHFARGQNFSYGLADIGRYYRDYLRLMKSIEIAAPGRVLLVEHEKLVENTDDQIRRLLDYIGVEDCEACRRFFDNKRAVRTASSEQVRQPIFRDGLEHWRNYEVWLQPLREALTQPTPKDNYK